MSLVNKRPGSPFWYVTKTRKSTKTSNRKLAEEFARKTLTAAWRRDALGEERHTWAALAADWLDVKEDRASCKHDAMVIERFSALLTRRKITDLAEVSGDVIGEYAKEAKARASASTANRHLTTVRAMMHHAKAKEWIPAVPTIVAYEVTPPTGKWWTIDQFNKVIPYLPEWIADMAVVAVQTGMRYSNVAGMRWDWLSSDGTVCVVPAVSTKTRRTYTVPLSSLAQAIVAKRHAVGAPGDYVFIGRKRVGRQFYGDKRLREPGQFVDCAPAPVDAVKYHWRKACKLADVPYMKWHGLRHTWASWHVQNETPDRVLSKMGGWAGTRMLETYAHLATSHLVKYADNLNTPPAQPGE